jgi:hypothetical protein
MYAYRYFLLRALMRVPYLTVLKFLLRALMRVPYLTVLKYGTGTWYLCTDTYTVHSGGKIYRELSQTEL